jgi:hemerythrin
MAYIDWTSQLSVGIPRFDEQHKRLIALINELHEGMRSKKGKETVGKVLNGLVDYTRVHFKAEEDAFGACKYPEGAEHKKQHDALLSKVVELKGKHDSGALFVTVETLEFLSSWLKGHIMDADRKYGPFLAGKVT